MKTISIVLTVALFGVNALPAQVAQTEPTPTASTDGAMPYEEVQRDAHSRVWARVSYETNELGTVTTNTSSYQEIATGLHFRAGDQWLPSEAKIEILPNNSGAAASRGQHKAIFPPEIKSGIIELQTPDNQWLRSRVWGLAYFDGATGESVLIAEVKESEGQVEGDNTVIYPDAFTDIQADIRYTYTLAGFEQDVVFRTQPPGPEKFGMSKTSTRLQVLTEFVESPTPTKESRQAGGLVDQALGFGQMSIGSGKAFSVDAEGDTTGEVPVAKEWTPMEGRDFLIEEVHYEKVADQLQKLPAAGEYKGASLQRRGTGENVIAGLKKIMPKRYAKVAPKPGTKRMAQAKPNSAPGFVMDYVTLNNQANFTFAGNTNYLVIAAVNLSGTTKIEGGTIVKFASGITPKINITGTIDCRTSMYRPAVFTAKDDNSVGEAFGTGSPGSTKYGSGLTFSTSGMKLNYLRFSYANTAISLQFSSGQISMTNMQFMNCLYPIDSSGAEENTIIVDNGLFYSSLYVIKGGDNLVVRGNHLTVNQCNGFGYAGLGTFIGDLYLTNCLVVAATGGWGSYGGISIIITDHTAYFTTDPGGIFQTVGAAGHYLAVDAFGNDLSGFRNQGNANINPSLLDNLKLRTTYPPTPITANITTETLLPRNPLVQRDISGIPDYGYHYDPLDYVVSGRTVSANLTLKDGVVLGTYGALNSYGLGLISGTFVSEGTPTRLNWIVRYNTVQEQSTTSWAASTAGSSVRKLSSTSVVSTRFTGWSLLGATGEHFYDSGGSDTPTPSSFSHSQFGGGKFTVYPGTGLTVYPGPTALSNCLWQRVYVMLRDNDSDSHWYLFNNLFYGGTLYYRAEGDYPELRAYDNLFDKTKITLGGGANFTHDYNGYVTTQNRLSPTAAHDVILPSSPEYLSGPLGNWYLETTAPTSTLMDADIVRTPALVGLYHYTVETATDSKEGNDQIPKLDIGFHYVAVNGNNQPIDTDGDGLADYFEDINGNGQSDLGETPWVATVSIATTDPDAYEDGHDPGTITITRTTDSLAVPLTVLIQMSGSATEGTDYFPVGTQVTIEANDTSADVFLCPYTDFFPAEGSESVTVTLQNSTDYRITGANSATLNIADGSTPTDQVVSVELARANACENNGQSGSFTIWRTGGNLVGPLTVNFQLTGSATEETDYLPVGAQVIIPANASSASVAIEPLPDAITEVSESAVLTLQSDANYTLGSSFTATVNVKDTCTENGSYVYPLMPGTASWINATPEERVASVVIPQSWRSTATSWQFFCSAIGNPYFGSAFLPGYDISETYAATRVGTVSVLSDVDGAPDFGVNALRYVEELNITSIKTSDCGDASLCGLDYIIICYMAGLDSSLNTMNQASRQKLFRLAVWDAADFGNSPGADWIASGPVRLMYIIYNKPEVFRGAFPPEVVLPALTEEQSAQLEGGSLPEELLPFVYSVKAALGLDTRP